MRRTNIPRAFLSITFRLGYFDEFYTGQAGTVPLLFDQLPHETFFRRSRQFFKHIYNNGGTYSLQVKPETTTINISISHEQLRRVLVLFNHFFGYGKVSVPEDIEGFLREEIQTPVNFDRTMIMLPANEEFFPKLVNSVCFFDTKS